MAAVFEYGYKLGHCKTVWGFSSREARYDAMLLLTENQRDAAKLLKRELPPDSNNAQEWDDYRKS